MNLLSRDGREKCFTQLLTSFVLAFIFVQCNMCILNICKDLALAITKWLFCECAIKIWVMAHGSASSCIWQRGEGGKYDLFLLYLQFLLYFWFSKTNYVLGQESFERYLVLPIWYEEQEWVRCITPKMLNKLNKYEKINFTKYAQSCKKRNVVWTWIFS